MSVIHPSALIEPGARLADDVHVGPFCWVRSGAVIGSILYRACIAIAIQLGLSANDLKLITAVLLFIILVLSQSKKKKVNANA